MLSQYQTLTPNLTLSIMSQVGFQQICVFYAFPRFLFIFSKTVRALAVFAVNAPGKDFNRRFVWGLKIDPSSTFVLLQFRHTVAANHILFQSDTVWVSVSTVVLMSCTTLPPFIIESDMVWMHPYKEAPQCLQKLQQYCFTMKNCSLYLPFLSCLVI